MPAVAPRRRFLPSLRVAAGGLVAVLVLTAAALGIYDQRALSAPIVNTAYIEQDLSWVAGPLGQAPERGGPALTAELRLAAGTPAIAPVALGAIAPSLRKAVVAREDQQFVHRLLPLGIREGFDRAVARLQHQRDVGGSTIPQQLAKNLFTDGSADTSRKSIELLHATVLTLTSDRAAILEAYLNTIEFGPGVYGACAASWFYFDRAPAALSAKQSMLLAALMPAPKQRVIYPMQGRYSASFHATAKKIRQLEALSSLYPRPYAELFSVRPAEAEETCATMPDVVRERLAATRDRHGHPRFADDQSYWPRMTREYTHGDLPFRPTTRFAATLRALAAHTPGA